MTEMQKHKGYVIQPTLKLILEGQELKDKVECYEPLTFEKICELNKKKFKELRLKKLKNEFSDSLYFLSKVIEDYKELYNKTEYYEDKSIVDFNFKQWNTIRKVNGRLTRYYNELLKVFNGLE